MPALLWWFAWELDDEAVIFMMKIHKGLPSGLTRGERKKQDWAEGRHDCTKGLCGLYGCSEMGQCFRIFST